MGAIAPRPASHPGMEMMLEDVVQTYKKREETLAERMERERLEALEKED